MRLTPLFQRLSFRILTILLPLVFVVSGVQSAVAQTCPSGTEKNENNECVLNSAELRLRKALTLKDGTILNCQRHRIVPDPNSPNAKPQVAIFLNNAKDIQIKNCTIFGFDFGVFVINSKQVPPAHPHQLRSHNKIQARYVAVSLMAVDNAEISRNDLKWLSRGGRAVYVGRNSDENRIINNFMHADLANTSKAFRAPGVEIPSNTAVTEGSAVLITETEGGEPALLTIIIDNEQIFQCGTTRCQEAISPGADLAEAPNTDGDFSQNNVVEGNTIKIKITTVGVPSVDGIVLAVPLGTLVGNNVIEGAKVSIRPGIQLVTKQFPGKCSSSGRFCLRGLNVADLNRDCNIPNFDPGGNTDQCPLGPAPANISWLSRDTVIQDNIIRLSTDTGISPLGHIL